MSDTRANKGGLLRLGIGLIALIFVGALLKIGIGYLAGSQQFTPVGGGFTISTPAKLVENTQTVDLPNLGKVDFHVFRGSIDNTDYLVGYLDYPQEFVSHSDPKETLEQAASSMISRANGKLVSETTDFASGGPERDVVSSLQTNGVAFIQRDHFTLVGNRLFRVSLTAPEKNNVAYSAESDSFLHSLKVLLR